MNLKQKKTFSLHLIFLILTILSLNLFLFTYLSGQQVTIAFILILGSFFFFAKTFQVLYERNQNKLLKNVQKNINKISSEATLSNTNHNDPVSFILDRFKDVNKNSRELSWQLNFLQQAFRITKFGLILFDEKLQIIMLNDLAAKILDIKPGAKNNTSQINLTPQIKEIAKVALSGKKVKEKIELTYNMRSLEGRGLPVSINGKTIGSLISLQDTTKIDALADVKKDFIANVSHDLRTPIASIKSLTEALLAGAKDNQETLDSFLNELDKQSERLSSLARDILDLSKIENKGSLALEKLAIAPLLEQSVNSFKREAQKKRLKLSLSVKDNTQAKVDPEQLMKAFHNLLDNSIKYTPENGNISVSLTKSNGSINISFKDTGIGIAQKEQMRIFERFYRISKSRSIKGGGTGLGLSIVKHVVENHSGKVGVKSHLNEGFEFTITLPA